MIEQASRIAHELLKVDRELADIVESLAHHQPSRGVARRLAELCDKAGKPLQAASWRLIAGQLTQEDLGQ